MTQIATFDVFDTALTRLIGGPRQVFVETGRRLHRAGRLNIDAEAYAAAREQAGWSLTSDLGRHPPLHRIADELAERLGLPAASESFAGAELEVELDVCRAVPGFSQRAAQSRRNTGRGIVFISDTPLPTKFLRGLLVREGVLVDGDRLYTSSESRASKQEGGLFDVVAADLGVSGAQLVHVGDDSWADLAHGRLHGWNSTLDTRARLTKRERDLDEYAVSTQGLGPRLAGAARMGRLAATDDGVEPGLAGIASAVALPLLAGYGLWALRQAELMELDRLYFIARDGEVFRAVTRRLAQRANNKIECRYLYGSRLSWQLASAGTSARDRLSDPWLPDDAAGGSLSVRAALALVDVTPRDAWSVTKRPIFAVDRVELPLGDHGWAEFQVAVASGPLAAVIDQRARERRDLLLRYLDQEGVTGSGRVGLVDVGWTGRAARALEDVLVDGERPRPAAHLFLGLLASAPSVMGADLHKRSHGWLLDEARGRGMDTGDADPVMVVESFCMGSEGHTVGYEVVNDRVAPRLAAKANPCAVRWPLADFRRALDQALDALLDGAVLDPTVDLRPLVARQVMNFWNNPTRQEAIAWGAQPYGEDFHNAGANPLATPVTARRILTRLGVGVDSWREPTYWLPGTIKVSRQPWRHLLAAVARGQRSARRLRRIPRRLRGELAIHRRARS